MKFKGIEIKSDYAHGYERGARPSIRVAVELQYGSKSYESMTIALDDADSKAVIDEAIKRAIATLGDVEDYSIEATPGEPEPEVEPAQAQDTAAEPPKIEI